MDVAVRLRVLWHVSILARQHTRPPHNLQSDSARANAASTTNRILQVTPCRDLIFTRRRPDQMWRMQCCPDNGQPNHAHDLRNDQKHTTPASPMRSITDGTSLGPRHLLRKQRPVQSCSLLGMPTLRHPKCVYTRPKSQTQGADNEFGVSSVSPTQPKNPHVQTHWRACLDPRLLGSREGGTGCIKTCRSLQRAAAVPKFAQNYEPQNHWQTAMKHGSIPTPLVTIAQNHATCDNCTIMCRSPTPVAVTTANNVIVIVWRALWKLPNCKCTTEPHLSQHRVAARTLTE